MLSNLLIFFGSLALFWFAAQTLGGGAQRKRTLKRIAQLKQRKTSVPKVLQETSLRRKNNEMKGLMHWLTKPLPDFKQLGNRLERAGKTISPKQYALRRFLWFLLIFAIVSLLLKKSLVMGISLGIIFGVWLPLKVLQFAVNKQTKAFLRLFPDALDLIVRGLRSGLPVSESLVLVSHEVVAPVGTIFTNIAQTMKLGVSLEKALQEVAAKLDMTEFNFFATSIVLQRETGGNLAEILNNLSEVLRSRYLMRMKIRALSSEARASAMIIGALPFVVILAVTVLDPLYMLPMIDDHRGNVCSFIAAGMMSLGIWTMNRMAKFEI